MGCYDYFKRIYFYGALKIKNVFSLENDYLFTSKPAFYFSNYVSGHSSLADVMFGLRQRDTGLTKYPVR